MKKTISELIEFSIINVNKPAGMTSHDVVSKVKKIFNAKRAGHFGTLDPMVTGVLPVALNRSCKLSDFFMKKDKEYVGSFYLHKDVSKTELEKQMKKFIGVIKQKPPVRSRVKRVERKRKVNRFDIINKKGRSA